MKNGNKIGVGFIGAGEISLLQAKAVKAHEGAELIGLWNRTESNAIRRAEEEGCKRYLTVPELLEDPDIDLVFVLTNLETHFEYAKMAMEAGKDVLVEKPICASVEQGKALKDVADRTGKLCMPGHNMIHEQSLERAKRLIDEKAIGDVVSCYVLYNIHHAHDRSSTLPGVLRHLMTHNLYTMIYLVGRPKRVTALKANRNHPLQPEKEDIGMVLLELDNGGIAHLCMSFAADDKSGSPWSWMVKVIGTHGTTQYSYNDWVESKAGISHSVTYTAYQETITNEVRYLIDKVISGKKDLISGIDDAIWAQRAMDAALESIEKGVTVTL